MNKNTGQSLEKEREKETKHKENSYIYTSTVVGSNSKSSAIISAIWAELCVNHFLSYLAQESGAKNYFQMKFLPSNTVV